MTSLIADLSIPHYLRIDAVLKELSLKCFLVLTVLLIGLTAAGPATAFTDLDVRLEPIQPLPGEDFVIVIEGMSESLPVGLEDLVRTDQGLEIQLYRPSCAPPCPAQSFRLDLEIDGSSNPFSEGLVELWINGRVGIENDRSTLFRTYFAVGELFFHSMTPETVLNPWTPTDNERVQLLVPVVANVCGPSPPRLDRIERNGSLISVFLNFSPGFGGEFLNGESPDPKCSPAVPYLSATPVDLGVLEAGTYNLEVFFRSTRDDSLPIRVNKRPFQVTDAPDLVSLQGDRFQVEVEWRDAAGQVGVGKPVPGPSADSTLFTFFGSENWELLVKVLDGCSMNNRFWVFGAAATDVEYTITVTDTQTQAVWTYTNPLGNPSAAINDTDAFNTCP